MHFRQVQAKVVLADGFIAVDSQKESAMNGLDKVQKYRF
jgi:hypothetical protein